MFALPIHDSLICFGDSLTQYGSQVGGFVASLQDLYQRRLEVISRGYGGYTSRQGIVLCPTLFAGGDTEQGTKCKLGIVWLGTNDSIAEGFDQHVPIDEYEKNMTSILSHFSDTDALLVTPHTVVAGKFAGHIDDKSMREYGQRLYQVSQQVNKERQNKNEAGKIAVLDMNAVFVNAAKTVRGGLASLLVEDGLHINEAGYKVVFQAMRDAIFAEFPHLHPDRLPFEFKAWRDLDLSADSQGQKEQLRPRIRGINGR